MKIDKSSFINFGQTQNTQNTQNVDTKHKEITKEKTVQLNSNIALANYNKSFVVSFKGKTALKNSFKIRDLTDEEFEEYKTRLSEKKSITYRCTKCNKRYTPK